MMLQSTQQPIHAGTTPMYCKITGHRDTTRVTVSDDELKISGRPMYDDIRFDWGQCNIGSSKLALAILCEHIGEDEAVRYHQSFMRRVVSELPAGDFTARVNMTYWINFFRGEIGMIVPCTECGNPITPSGHVCDEQLIGN